MVRNEATSPLLPKCHHYPVVDVLFIGIGDTLNSDYVCLWNNGNYAAIKEERDRFHSEFLFEGPPQDQCYEKFLKVINELVEMYVFSTTE